MTSQLAEAMAVLERTPATFRALRAGLPGVWTSANEGPETFSALDNLDGEAVGPCRAYLPILDR